MDITEKIHNAIEWANKRLTLQGQELSQEQKNYITFALSQNFTDNNQALQLQQTGVIKSVCKHENITRSDGLDECLDCGARNY